MIDKKIGIIGGGNMGEAIFSHLAKKLEKSTKIMVSELDASRRDYLQTKYRIIVEIDNNVVVKYSDVIILAVKPQDLKSVLEKEICCGVSENKLIISIAAGVTTKHIESFVGKTIPVVRAMPNMGAKIGAGITAIAGGSAVRPEHMKLAKTVLSVIGDVVEVDEKSLDAVTAISGSGPAYFFYLVEALTEAAMKLGLGKDVAGKLVLKTGLGSMKLLDALKEDAGNLRKKVTSKGGTTEAAFKVLEAKKVNETIIEAVKAAEKRSTELSGG